MCKIRVWLYCRIRWVLGDGLHSLLVYASESKAGTAVPWRSNSWVLLPHLMGWILLMASLLPGDLLCSKSWWFSFGSPQHHYGALLATLFRPSVIRGSQLPPGQFSLFRLPQLLERDRMGFMKVFPSFLLALRSVTYLHMLCCMAWWQRQGCRKGTIKDVRPWK